MATRRRRRREWLKLLGGLMVVALLLCLMPARLTAPLRVVFNEVASPAQTAAYQGSGEVLARTGTLADSLHARDRERELAREVIRLTNERATVEDAARRLAEGLASVRALEVREFPVRMVQAPVASYDTSATRHTITVRAGSTDGVRAGLAVASDGALVGTVTEAGPFTCRVRLITDPGSALPCRLSRGAVSHVCVLQGTGHATCEADWLDTESFPEEGDMLVTTTLEVGGVRGHLALPEGLPAARLGRVGRDEMQPLFLNVEAVPMTDLTRLERVEVLIPEPPVE